MNLHLDYDRVEIKRVASPADYPQYKKAYGLFYKDRLIKIFASYGLAAQYAEDSLAEELMLNRPKFLLICLQKDCTLEKQVNWQNTCTVLPVRSIRQEETISHM